MATLEELVVELRGDISGLTKAMNDASTVVKGATTSISSDAKKAGEQSASAFSKFGGAVQVAAGNLIASGIQQALGAISRAAGQASKDFLDFSKATAEVNSILPQNDKLTRQTTDSFIRFAANFGGTAQGQAKAFYQIVSSGITDQTKATKLLNVANKAAVAGLTSIETAAGGLTAALAVYESTTFDAAAASDVLFVAVREGRTTFGELSANIGKVTAIAKTAGASFDEVSGSLAFLTKSGLSTEEATTGLRALFTSIIKPSSEAAQAAKELGIELNTQALRSKGLAGVLEDVRNATGGSAEQMARLFPNVRALSAVSQIAAGNFDDFSKILAKTAEAGGAAETAFKQIELSADFQFNKLVSSLRALPQVFLSVNEGAIAEFLKSLNESLPEAVATVAEAFADFTRFSDVVVSAFEFIGNQIGTNIGLWAGLGETVLNVITGDFSEAMQVGRATVETFASETKGNLDKAFEPGILSKFADGLDEGAGKVRTMREEFSALGSEAPPPLDTTGQKVDELTQKLRDAQQSAREFAGELIAASQSASDQEQLANDELQLMLDERLITEEEFFINRMNMLSEMQALEQQQLQDALDQKLISEEQFQQASIQLQRKQAVEEGKLRLEKQKAEQKQRDQQLQQTSQMFGNLASLTQTGNKTLGRIGKAAAISQATIDTYVGANKALAQGGPFLGPALAASIVVAGLVNVAKIASQPLNTGIDSVPGIGNRDNFPAVLTPGERVVPKETNQDLTRFLSGNDTRGGMGGGDRITINVEVNDVFQQDPREVGLAVVNAINEASDANGVKILREAVES